MTRSRALLSGLLGIALCALLFTSAWADAPDAGQGTLSACARPPSDPSIAMASIPRPLRLDGMRIQGFKRSNGWLQGSFNASLDIETAFERLEAQVVAAGLTVINKDFEGFEAELYVKADDHPGVIRLLEAACPNTVLIGFQLPTGLSL